MGSCIDCKLSHNWLQYNSQGQIKSCWAKSQKRDITSPASHRILCHLFRYLWRSLVFWQRGRHCRACKFSGSLRERHFCPYNPTAPQCRQPKKDRIRKHNSRNLTCSLQTWTQQTCTRMPPEVWHFAGFGKLIECCDSCSIFWQAAQFLSKWLKICLFCYKRVLDES